MQLTIQIKERLIFKIKLSQL